MNALEGKQVTHLFKTGQFTRNCSVSVKDACAEYHRSPWLPLTENITVLREPEFL